jgi:peptidoglycan/LPS O-acetylase OafA/YrhL
MLTQNKRLMYILLSVAVLLLFPFVAMQFSNEMDWSLFDFVIAGVLLVSTGLGCELVLRKVKKREHRIILCVVVFLVLLLIWAELAIGVFGSPITGN